MTRRGLIFLLWTSCTGALAHEDRYLDAGGVRAVAGSPACFG
jgi:hypothetical protein